MGGWVDRRQNTTWPLLKMLAGNEGMFFWKCVFVSVRACVLVVTCEPLCRCFYFGVKTYYTLTHSHTHTPLAYVNINKESLCGVSGGSIAWKMRGEVAYICHRRGVTWTTALLWALESVGACMATQGGKVLGKEKWMERGSLSWSEHSSGSRDSHELMQVTSAQQRRAFTPTQQSERGGERSKFICTTQSYPPLLIPAS